MNGQTNVARASAHPIPEGFHTVTPYLIVKNALDAIAFYQQAFGAKERFRLPMPDGRIGHAELLIGSSIIMLADEFPEHESLSPDSLHGSGVAFIIYTIDADAAFRQAVEAGAYVHEPMDDKFWGDRAGTVVDPFGHKWTLMTHVEDVPPLEIKRRLDQLCARPSAAPAR